jgi:MFS family permease
MRRVLIVASAAVLVDTIFFSALAPLLPELVDTYGLSKAGAGLLTAAFAIGAVAGAIPAGYFALRAGTKLTMLVGLAIVACATIAFAFVGEAWSLDLARFVQGFGSAFVWTGALAWILDVAPKDRRGEVVGYAFAAAIGGALLGPLLGGAASVVGLRATFGAVAAIIGVLAVVVYLTPAPPRGKRQSLWVLARAVRDAGVRRGLYLLILPGLLLGVITVLAPLELSRLGWSAVAIAGVFFVSAVMDMVASPLVGRWSDRRGRIEPVWVALAMSGAAVLVLPWVDVTIVLAIVVALAAVSFGLFAVPGAAILSDATERAGIEMGLGVTLMNLAWSPGDALGAATSGVLADLGGDTLAYGVVAVIIAITAIWFGKSTRSGRPDRAEAS